MTERQTATVRILLVDDHLVVRSGLRLLIERSARYVVVAEAATAAEAIAAAQRERPDVILLDLDLGADNGIECLVALRAAAPGVRVLVLTGMRDADQHHQAVRLGAAGVLLKDKAPELLFRALERVYAGENWLDRATTARLLAELADGPKRTRPNPEQVRIASLTPRERDVVALVTEGLRNKQIADRLNISEATVRHHLTAVFTKLQVPDRLALSVYAFQHGLSASNTNVSD